MRPILPWLGERLAEEEASKARAVDEQIPLDPHAAVEPKRAHVSALAVQFDVDDPPLGPLHPPCRRPGPQIGSEPGRIELIGIIVGGEERDGVGGRRLELAPPRHDVRDRVAEQVVVPALRDHPPPEMVEMDSVQVGPKASERVQVRIADPPEIAKLDPQFVGRARRPHELRLVEAEALDEIAQVRKSRLADSDDPDLLGFDEVDGT